MSEYRLCDKIDIQPISEDRTLVYVKATNKSYEIGKEEAIVLSMIDGSKTPIEISQVCGFYSAEEVALLEEQFAKIGLIQFDNTRRKFRSLKWKIPVFCPNNIFGNNKKTRFIYWTSLSVYLFFGLLASIQMLYHLVAGVDGRTVNMISSFKLSDFGLLDLFTIYIILGNR